MIIDNYLTRGAVVKGEDLDELFRLLNNTQPLADGITIASDERHGGIALSLISQPEAVSAEGGTTSEQTFVMSLDGSTVNITAGAIIVNENSINRTYSVPAGSVDLSAQLTPTTVYIYVKLVANWINGEFQLYPTLTVATDNFFGNTTRAPLDDLGQIYHNLGTVTITKPDDVLVYTLNQTVYGNRTIEPFDNTSYKINQIYQAKSTDTDIDTTYQVYVNTGQATLPDNTVITPQVNSTISNTGTKYAYLQITATQNANGYWTGFDAETILSSSTLSNSADVTNALIGTAGLALTQAQQGNFISDARVF
ncbi:MAG: hypothetical protein GY750_20970 [Lentisphaerae bacterium]|nr:hypothetical protein [Lentisphaerota bacterium]